MNLLTQFNNYCARTSKPRTVHIVEENSVIPSMCSGRASHWSLVKPGWSDTSSTA